MQNTYPRWKNGLLIFIVLIAVIYAIPNLYTEYPAIEISSTITPQMSVEKQVAQALKDAHIAYYNIAHHIKCLSFQPRYLNENNISSR